MHNLTNLEKDVIRDLSGSMHIYKDEKKTSLEKLGQSFEFDIETNTFERGGDGTDTLDLEPSRLRGEIATMDI